MSGDPATTNVQVAATKVTEREGAGAATAAPDLAELDNRFRLFLLPRCLFGLRARFHSRLSAGADVDLARFHRLGDLAHQLDGEQAILQIGALDAHEVGQLGAAFERAGGNPRMELIAFLGAVLRLAARDHQQVLLLGDVDLVTFEAGYGKRDPVAVIADALEIERRVIVRLVAARAVLEEIEQTIEADGRTPIGGKINSSSHNVLLYEQHGEDRPIHGDGPSLSGHLRVDRVLAI
jgi:hypothetical protein